MELDKINILLHQPILRVEESYILQQNQSMTDRLTFKVLHQPKNQMEYYLLKLYHHSNGILEREMKVLASKRVCWLKLLQKIVRLSSRNGASSILQKIMIMMMKKIALKTRLLCQYQYGERKLAVTRSLKLQD